MTVQEFTQPTDGREETEPLQKEGSWISLSVNGLHGAVVAGNTLQFYQVYLTVFIYWVENFTESTWHLFYHQENKKLIVK